MGQLGVDFYSDMIFRKTYFLFDFHGLSKKLSKTFLENKSVSKWKL
jgi:hypothetical protein